MPRRPFIVTTQPGWAFATLSELRAAGGGGEYVHFHHRDSTLVCPDGLSALAFKILRTPAEVFGEVVSTTSRRGEDATRQLVRLMRPDAVKRAVLGLLPYVEGTRPRRYSVACEALGRTTVRRQDLAQQVEQVFRTAFSGWRRSSDHAVRIFCKADPDFAFVGVQLHSNLGDDDSGRPGALRRHLACGLLQLAGVDADQPRPRSLHGDRGHTRNRRRVSIKQARSAIGFEVDSCRLRYRRTQTCWQENVSVLPTVVIRNARYRTHRLTHKDRDEYSVRKPIPACGHGSTGSSPTCLLTRRRSNHYARLPRTGRSPGRRSWAASEERYRHGAAGHDLV